MPSHSAKILQFPSANTQWQTLPEADHGIGPVLAAEPRLSPMQASLDDLLDPTATGSMFSTTARARFASLYTTLSAARASDAVEKDDAVMQLQAELPRAFMLEGWSDGALALMSAVNHGIANRRGIPLDATQYLRVLDAVKTLKDMPALRMERSIDIIDALELAGIITEPPEAESLQVIGDAD